MTSQQYAETNPRLSNILFFSHFFCPFVSPSGLSGVGGFCVCVCVCVCVFGCVVFCLCVCVCASAGLGACAAAGSCADG